MTAHVPILPRADAEVQRAAGCESLIWQPARGVLATQVAGAITAGVAQGLAAALRKVVHAHGRVVVIHDWEQMTDYEPEARVILTDIGRELKKQIDLTHILLRSRIVALAVQAATLLVPNIKVHGSRVTLERALHDAIRAAAPRSS